MYFQTKKRNIAKSFIKNTTKPKLPYLVLFLRTKTLPSKCMSSSQETLDVARQLSQDNKLLGLTPFSMLKKTAQFTQKNKSKYFNKSFQGFFEIGKEPNGFKKRD